MAVIYIENKQYEAAEGKNLLETCLSLGFNIPYFCWHPALGSVGACRQCAVKKFRDGDDKKGKIVMSCMEPVQNGMRISIDDPEVKEFRAGVIELLMTNHPHDCPVCDEGGECHLQDMTVMTGHSRRRFQFKKRTYRDQNLGPFLQHEMNRCIQCYRCVRFYRDYAGGSDFDVFGIARGIYFGRHNDGILESPFSGNLAEVCPTGVFTDKIQREHYARKWDLTFSPSVCVHCGLGCNIFPAERYGKVRRIRPRYNDKVNGYFICDRGRYGYGFINSDTRMFEIKSRTDKKDIFQFISDKVKDGSCIGIGSPRASVESNFALWKLVGRDNYYSGLAARESALLSYAIRIMNETQYLPSMRETEKADAVIVLGEDIENTAPMLFLSLLQSAKNSMKIPQRLKIPDWDDGAVRNGMKREKTSLVVLSPFHSDLYDHASLRRRASYARISRIAVAAAGFINKEIFKDISGHVNLSDKDNKLAEAIAEMLSKADNPLIVTGIGCGSEDMLRSASLLEKALSAAGRKPGLFITVPECNSMGAALIGAPHLGEAMAAQASDRKKNTLILLENDICRRTGRLEADNFFSSFEQIILIDSNESAACEIADLILPSAPFTESDGTLINNELRAQRFIRVMDPQKNSSQAWKWISDIMKAAERPEADAVSSLDSLHEMLAAEFPDFGAVGNAASAAGYRISGRKIPRQTGRISGRTAVTSNTDVHEHKPAEDTNSPLSFTMEGYGGAGVPPDVIPFFWSPGWNSDQSVNKYQEFIGGPLKNDNSEQVPSEQVPSEQVPSEQVPSEQVPSEQVPSEQVPLEQVPVQDSSKRIVSEQSSDIRIVPARIKEPVFADQESASKYKNKLLVIPYHRVFGSEEMSVKSPYIKARLSGTPAASHGGLPVEKGPFLIMNKLDARTRNIQAIGANSAGSVRLRVAGRDVIIPVMIDESIPEGVVFYPSGFPGIEYLDIPAECEVEKL